MVYSVVWLLNVGTKAYVTGLEKLAPGSLAWMPVNRNASSQAPHPRPWPPGVSGPNVGRFTRGVPFSGRFSPVSKYVVLTSQALARMVGRLRKPTHPACREPTLVRSISS